MLKYENDVLPYSSYVRTSTFRDFTLQNINQAEKLLKSKNVHVLLLVKDMDRTYIIRLQMM